MGRGVAGPVAGDLPATARRVGVDGCQAGWLAATRAGGAWRFGVFERFADLWAHLDTGAVERVLVDVPIGIADDGVRPCDEAARDLLGARWNAVFRTPVRPAIELKREEGPDEDRRPAASELNEAATGYGISVQSWNIADKVAELAAVRDAHGLALDGPVREAHPELAFMAYDGQPIAYSKTSERGRTLRRRVLATEQSGDGFPLEAVYGRFPSTSLDRDDVLDAAVLALAAEGSLRSVPAAPEPGEPRIYYPDRRLDWED